LAEIRINQFYVSFSILAAREVVVEQIKLADAKLNARMASDGTIQPLGLLLVKLQKLTKNNHSLPAEQKTAESRPWNVAIQKFKLTNWAAGIEDQTLPKPARITADGITVTIENLDNKKGSKAQVSAAFQLNKAGTVRAVGTVGMIPIAAELGVATDKIALKSFQPDADTAVNVVQAFTPVQVVGAKGAEGQKNMLQRLVSFLILQIKGPMPLRVDLAQLKNFSADFVDASIKPPFSTHLEITNATMQGLSSDPAARADFTVEGKIDQSSRIQSSGQMNPLNAMQFTQVDFSLLMRASSSSLPWHAGPKSKNF
jgi:hypothetical protein